MPKMQLMGGEKDGLDIPTRSEYRPDIFYAVPNDDDEKIRKTKGTNAKQEMRDKLARLAYAFDPDASTSEVFRMVRDPSRDKARIT